MTIGFLDSVANDHGIWVVTQWQITEFLIAALHVPFKNREKLFKILAMYRQLLTREYIYEIKYCVVF